MSFSTDRHVSIENMMDPTGKQWVIHGERGSALVHARPNPDRVDAQIPKEFGGKWTSPTVLKEKMITWLNRQWDHAERVTLENSKKRAPLQEGELLPDPEPEVEKQTPEESLAALDPEIAAELGDVIAVKEEEKEEEPEVVKPKVSKKKASKKKAGK
jgi:hypothetical protein